MPSKSFKRFQPGKFISAFQLGLPARALQWQAGLSS